MKGRFYLAQRTPDSLRNAIDQFNRAIVKDPNYAQAYAGLADTYVILLDRDIIPRNEASPKILSAAQRAIELDSTLAEPHAALAVLRGMADWDWTAAEAEFRKAIALNQNDVISHHWYSTILQKQSRSEEALAENEKALALDPASPQINANHAVILIDLHRYDEALAELNKLITANPEFPPSNVFPEPCVLAPRKPGRLPGGLGHGQEDVRARGRGPRHSLPAIGKKI